jgi:hypothetical protein
LAADLDAYRLQVQKTFALPQPEEEGGEVPEVAAVGFVSDLLAD